MESQSSIYCSLIQTYPKVKGKLCKEYIYTHTHIFPLSPSVYTHTHTYLYNYLLLHVFPIGHTVL